MRKSSARTSSKVRKSTITSLRDKKKNDTEKIGKNFFDTSHIKPKVDNKTPALPIKTYYKAHRLEADAQTIMKIDAENIELIKRLNAIHRSTGSTDCWNLEKTDFSKIIEKNNETLARLVESNGSYSTADSTRQRKKSKAEKEKNKYDSSKNAKSSHISEKISLTKPIEDRTKPICYFEIVIAVNYRKLGNLIFQLFDNVVPKTCENFISFCKGFNGLSYQGTPFHRIVPGYWCQGGDVQKFNGSGETSIYGDTFEDENFELKHSERGILSTCGFEKDSNCSKFNLTFKRLESVDGKRVVFGKVIDGFATLEEIERYGSIAGKPTMRIVVSKCGVLDHDELEN